MSKTTTISLSEKQRVVFEFFRNWDERISTLDDLQNKDIFRGKINYSIAVMRKLQASSEEKLMRKYPNDTVKLGEKLLANAESEWYVELNKACDNLLFVLMNIDSLYELKNRKSEENFKLRAEIAQSKINANGG